MTTDLKEILKRYDLKVTPVRMQVLEALIRSDVALSHADITEALGDENLDKVTLYRTLSVFTEKGLVHKVATEDRNWLYAILMEGPLELAAEHAHAHFVCDACEKIFCFPLGTQANDGVNSIREGFIVREKEIRLHGLCPTCHN